METVEGCLASCRKSKAPHAPSGINSPANQRSLWENEEVTTLPGFIKSVADKAGMLYHLYHLTREFHIFVCDLLFSHVS